MSGKVEKRRARNWCTEDIKQAVQSVKNGNSVNFVSKQFGIPRRTLRNHLASGSMVKKMGRNTTLTEGQENELKLRIIRLSDVGMPLVPKLLKRYVYVYCESNGITNMFSTNKEMAGTKWLNSFLKRHPDIARRKSQTMNPARAQKLNRFIVSDYFTKLGDLLHQLNLMDKPERIYNMDEKGCRLTVHNKPTVLAKRGAKRVHLIANEHAENVTVVGCGNAIGNALPPMVLFKGKRLKQEWVDNLPVGTVVAMTEKGSMTTDTFLGWLQHLARFKPPGRILLIFDGASSHLDYTIVEAADEHDITLFCLPSNTTHELQPMDKSVYRSFEYHWDQEVLAYWERHPHRQLTKARFGLILSKVWENCMTPRNIKSGFRATGIYPFDPHVIPEEAYAPSEITEIAEYRPQQGNEDRHQPLQRETPEQSPQLGNGNQNPISLLQGEIPVQLPHLGNDDPQPQLQQVIQGQTTPQDVLGTEESPSLTFTAMLSTPKLTRKTQRVSRKAINSRAQVVVRSLFSSKSSNKEKKKNTSKEREKPVGKRKNSSEKRKILPKKGSSSSGKYNNRSSKLKTVSKEGKNLNAGEGTNNDSCLDQPSTSSGKYARESWYCFLCREERVADMRQCVRCEKWLHDECVGLTKSDWEAFTCHNCDG